MSVIAKNTTGSVINIAGQDIAANGQYTVQESERHLWASSDTLITKVGSGDIVINDGTNDLSSSDGLDLVKGYQQKIATDSENAPLNRTKTTKTGWHYQPHWLEINTSKYNTAGFYNEDVDGNDLGYVTCKIYDTNGTEITSAANEANAVKTVITWEPTEDYEIVASKIFQASAPSVDVRLWVEGLPDVSYANGGSRFFAEGGVNLKMLGDGAAADTDGRSSKYLTYNATYHTNKFEVTVKYPVGTAHSFALMWEIYLA